MSQTQLLSDLCSICHADTPKYRCPRCKTQTCSLPCYKRHQQRAACSGKRDPAAYVKKNDLATPTGVDRDYNYLKGIETTIGKANRTTSERGLGASTQANRKKPAARDPNSALGRYLERNSITIDHAPIGMSRQKSNNTRTTKSGNVHWTLEWVEAQGERCVRDDCLESTSLTELYEAMQNAREKEERRQLEIRRAQAKRKGLKRKREQDLVTSQQQLDEKASKHEVEFLQNVKSDDTICAANADTNINEHAESSSSLADIITEPQGLQNSIDEVASSTTAPLSSLPDAKGSPKLHFYLLKPTTATSSQVLIPLDATATLTEALRSQTVLEYPTIYVLPTPPEGLGKQFILEAGYMQTIEKHNKPQSGLTNNEVTHIRASAREPQHHQTENDTQLDVKSILAMLKRDTAQ